MHLDTLAAATSAGTHHSGLLNTGGELLLSRIQSHVSLKRLLSAIHQHVGEIDCSGWSGFAPWLRLLLDLEW